MCPSSFSGFPSGFPVEERPDSKLLYRDHIFIWNLLTDKRESYVVGEDTSQDLHSFGQVISDFLSEYMNDKKANMSPSGLLVNKAHASLRIGRPDLGPGGISCSYLPSATSWGTFVVVYRERERARDQLLGTPSFRVTMLRSAVSKELSECLHDVCGCEYVCVMKNGEDKKKRHTVSGKADAPSLYGAEWVGF